MATDIAVAREACKTAAAYRAWKDGGSFTDLEGRLEDLASAVNGGAGEVPAVLATGDVAQVLGVSHRHATKMFDAGQLVGWKIGTHRRMSSAVLRGFMLANGFPIERLDAWLRGVTT